MAQISACLVAAITSANADLLSIGTLRKLESFAKLRLKYKNAHENTFENVI